MRRKCIRGKVQRPCLQSPGIWAYSLYIEVKSYSSRTSISPCDFVLSFLTSYLVSDHRFLIISNACHLISETLSPPSPLTLPFSHQPLSFLLASFSNFHCCHRSVSPVTGNRAVVKTGGKKSNSISPETIARWNTRYRKLASLSNCRWLISVFSVLSPYQGRFKCHESLRQMWKRLLKHSDVYCVSNFVFSSYTGEPRGPRQREGVQEEGEGNWKTRRRHREEKKVPLFPVYFFLPRRSCEVLD